MSLRRITYISVAGPEIDQNRLEAIVAASQRNNRAQNITGGLVMCEGYFYQCLEGEETTLRALVAKIRSDCRHSEVVVISDEAASTRAFPVWSMADASQFFGAKFDDQIRAIARQVYH